MLMYESSQRMKELLSWITGRMLKSFLFHIVSGERRPAPE
jgi:hypothetical protein